MHLCLLNPPIHGNLYSSTGVDTELNKYPKWELVNLKNDVVFDGVYGIVVGETTECQHALRASR